MNFTLKQGSKTMDRKWFNFRSDTINNYDSQRTKTFFFILAIFQ
jgi:hypothetical protein